MAGLRVSFEKHSTTCFGFRVAAFTLDCPAGQGFFFARDEFQRNASVELRLRSNVVWTKAADTQLASELSTTPQKRFQINQKVPFENVWIREQAGRDGGEVAEGSTGLDLEAEDCGARPGSVRQDAPQGGDEERRLHRKLLHWLRFGTKNVLAVLFIFGQRGREQEWVFKKLDVKYVTG